MLEPCLNLDDQHGLTQPHQVNPSVNELGHISQQIIEVHSPLNIPFCVSGVIPGATLSCIEG